MIYQVKVSIRLVMEYGEHSTGLSTDDFPTAIAWLNDRKSALCNSEDHVGEGSRGGGE